MMQMNKYTNHIKNLIILTSILLYGLIGCKSPIDLDQNVNEVPMPTNPVAMSTMRFSIDGGGGSMRFIPNDPPEESRFSFRSYKLETIHVDTTERNSLRMAMKYSIGTDVSDSSRYEEVLPISLACEFDTIKVPILDNIPGPRERTAAMLKKFRLKTYIFSKKKDGPNGVRMNRSEKEFDLLEVSNSYNHADTYVYALRTRMPQGKPIITVHIESGFALSSVEFESLDKKFRANTSGRSIMKISF
jgi:hypothetical protein